MIKNQIESQVEKNGECLKTFLSKFNNVINMKILTLFILAISLLANFAFAAAPTASSCGGNVLTAGQSVAQGDYSVKLVSVYSGNLAAFQIFKNGQSLTLKSVYSGQTGTYNDNGNTISIQTCSASNSDSPKWADTKVSVSVLSPAPSPSPAPTPSPSPSPAPQPAPAPSPSPTATPATCDAPSLSGSGYNANGYTVRVATFTAGNPVLQVLKNGNHVTFVVAPVGSTQTVSNSGDSVQVNVCEASSSARTAKGTVSVSLATPVPAPSPSPTPAPQPAPQPTPSPAPIPAPSPQPAPSTCSAGSGTVLTPGAYVDLGNDVRLVLVNVYSSDYLSLQVKYKGEHKGFIYTRVGQNVEKTITTDSGDLKVSVNVCGGGSAAHNAEVQAGVTVQSAPQPQPTTQPVLTCDASSLIGSDYVANGYVVKVVTFAGSNPVFQVLKDGNHVTFVTVSVGTTQTVSNNGDSIQINVCEANAVQNVVKGTISVNLVNSPQPTPAPITNSTNTTAPVETIPPLPEQTTYVLTMHRGWNLFSVPFSVNVNRVTSTCAFYPSNIFEYVGSSYEHPSSLNTGKGFWFRTFNECTVTISGEQSESTQLNLNAGWNTISVTQPVALSSLSTCNIVKGPFEYDSTARRWNVASSLEPLKGYFVKVSDACTLSLEQ